MHNITRALRLAGRNDLARVFANALIGETIWGKEGLAHFFRTALRFEQYPPGGKTRGVRTSKVTLHNLDRAPDVVWDALEKFAEDLKTKSWKQSVGQLLQIYNQHRNHIAINITQQKAVDAPNPALNANAPKPTTNSKNVRIEFDPRDRTVLVRDLNDRANEPSAFTQGPRAYVLALKTHADWRDLAYRDILSFWSANRIKYHDYMAVD